MSKKHPFVSLIIPLYNAERFIAEAIESVKKQKYPSLEIIVIDDGSTDTSRTIIEQQYPEVIYSFQENKGPAAARNAGILLAKGEYLAFLDADDVWEIQAIQSLVKTFRENTEIDFVMGKIQLMKWDDDKKNFVNNGTPFWAHQLGSLMIRRKVALEVGLFDETFKHSEDAEWISRLIDNGKKLKLIEKCVIEYRIHGNNWSLSKNIMTNNFFKVLRASIHRKRKLKK